MGVAPYILYTISYSRQRKKSLKIGYLFLAGYLEVVLDPTV